VAQLLCHTATAKERFVWHASGLDGQGESSYIDSVILRDKDTSAASTADADITDVVVDAVLEERLYDAQNWRADVRRGGTHNVPHKSARRLVCPACVDGGRGATLGLTGARKRRSNSSNASPACTRKGAHRRVGGSACVGEGTRTGTHKSPSRLVWHGLHATRPRILWHLTHDLCATPPLILTCLFANPSVQCSGCVTAIIAGCNMRCGGSGES
jgi:hypothetical protein